MAIPESAKSASEKPPVDKKNASIRDVLQSSQTVGKVEQASDKATKDEQKGKENTEETTSAITKGPKEEELAEAQKAEKVDHPVDGEKKSTKVEEETIVEKEKVVKKGGKGCALPGCSCRNCSCFGCLLVILIIVLFAAILYFRPSFIWNSIKNYLNADYTPQTYSAVPTDAVIKRLETDLAQGKETQLTEQEMQSISADFLNVNDTRVDIEPNYFRIVTDVDNNADHPLWLILEIGQQTDSSLKITKIGFNRFGVPDFLKEVVSDTAFKALKLNSSGGNNSSGQLVSSMVDAEDEGIQIESVRFDKDKIIIKGKMVTSTK